MIGKLFFEMSTLANIDKKIFIRVYNKGSVQGFRDEHATPHFHVEIPTENIDLSVEIKTLELNSKHSFIDGYNPSEWSAVSRKIRKRIKEWLKITNKWRLNINYKYIGEQWNLENNYDKKDKFYVDFENLDFNTIDRIF